MSGIFQWSGLGFFWLGVYRYMITPDLHFSSMVGHIAIPMLIAIFCIACAILHKMEGKR